MHYRKRYRRGPGAGCTYTHIDDRHGHTFAKTRARKIARTRADTRHRTKGGNFSSCTNNFPDLPRVLSDSSARDSVILCILTNFLATTYILRRYFLILVGRKTSRLDCDNRLCAFCLCPPRTLERETACTHFYLWSSSCTSSCHDWERHCWDAFCAVKSITIKKRSDNIWDIRRHCNGRFRRSVSIFVTLLLII